MESDAEDQSELNGPPLAAQRLAVLLWGLGYLSGTPSKLRPDKVRQAVDKMLEELYGSKVKTVVRVDDHGRGPKSIAAKVLEQRGLTLDDVVAAAQVNGGDHIDTCAYCGDGSVSAAGGSHDLKGCDSCCDSFHVTCLREQPLGGKEAANAAVAAARLLCLGCFQSDRRQQFLQQQQQQQEHHQEQHVYEQQQQQGSGGQGPGGGASEEIEPADQYSMDISDGMGGERGKRGAQSREEGEGDGPGGAAGEGRGGGLGRRPRVILVVDEEDESSMEGGENPASDGAQGVQPNGKQQEGVVCRPLEGEYRRVEEDAGEVERLRALRAQYEEVTLDTGAILARGLLREGQMLDFAMGDTYVVGRYQIVSSRKGKRKHNVLCTSCSAEFGNLAKHEEHLGFKTHRVPERSWFAGTNMSLHKWMKQSWLLTSQQQQQQQQGPPQQQQGAPPPPPPPQQTQRQGGPLPSTSCSHSMMSVANLLYGGGQGLLLRLQEQPGLGEVGVQSEGGGAGDGGLAEEYEESASMQGVEGGAVMEGVEDVCGEERLPGAKRPPSGGLQEEKPLQRQRGNRAVEQQQPVSPRLPQQQQQQQQQPQEVQGLEDVLEGAQQQQQAEAALQDQVKKQQQQVEAAMWKLLPLNRKLLTDISAFTKASGVNFAELAAVEKAVQLLAGWQGVVDAAGKISAPQHAVAATAAAGASQAGTSTARTAGAAGGSREGVGLGPVAAAVGFARAWDLEGLFSHNAHLLMVEVQQLLSKGLCEDSSIVKDLAGKIRSAFSVCVGGSADVGRLREQQQVVQEVRKRMEWVKMIGQLAPAAQDRVWAEVISERELLDLGAGGVRALWEHLLQQPVEGQGPGAAAAGGGGAAADGVVRGVTGEEQGAATGAVRSKVPFEHCSDLQASVVLTVLHILQAERLQQEQQQQIEVQQQWQGAKASLLEMLQAGIHCSYNPVFSTADSLLGVVLEPLLILADQMLKVLMLPGAQQHVILTYLSPLRVTSVIEEWVGFFKEARRMLLQWGGVGSAAAAEAAFPCVVDKGGCWCPVCVVFLAEAAAQQCKEVMYGQV